MESRAEYEILESRADRKACRRIIMKLNSVRALTKTEKRLDYVYAALLAVLGIFVPMFCIPWLMTVNKPLFAFFFSAVSILIAVTIALIRRKMIFRSFYQVNNAHDYVFVKDGNHRLADFFRKDEVLLSTFTQKSCYIDLLYNWLCRRELAIPGEELKFYRVEYKFLQKYLNEPAKASLADCDAVLLMPFPGRLPDDVNRFYSEAGLLGVYLLNNVKA